MPEPTLSIRFFRLWRTGPQPARSLCGERGEPRGYHPVEIRTERHQPGQGELSDFENLIIEGGDTD